MRTHMQRSRIALLLAVALGCSDITNLEQQDPTRLLTKDVYKPEQAALLVNGAIGDFECAFFRYTENDRRRRWQRDLNRAYCAGIQSDGSPSCPIKRLPEPRPARQGGR